MAGVQPLKDLETVEKTSLKNGTGVAYLDFRQKLTPHYGRVAFDLLLGYTLLFLGVVVPLRLAHLLPSYIPLLVLVSAVSTGYWIAYLHLFMHEAAHFNLVPGRKWNDFLSNLLICSWSGQNTAAYRVIHWDHHRFLGEPNDTEHSYFNALNSRFLFEALTGIAALKVLLFRGKKLENQKTALDKMMPLAALVLNGLVLAALILLKSWPFALAWALGLAIFFPFFGALRQLLEHRDLMADSKADYSKLPHGKTTRLFREGPVNSTLGAAGFTRHLIHHWDPQVSYTRLFEVEKFLMETPLAEGVAAAKTTYLITFLKLFHF